MLAAVGNITRLFGCSLLSLHSSYPHDSWSSGPVNSAVPGILDLILGKLHQGGNPGTKWLGKRLVCLIYQKVDYPTMAILLGKRMINVLI